MRFTLPGRLLARVAAALGLPGAFAAAQGPIPPAPAPAPVLEPAVLPYGPGHCHAAGHLWRKHYTAAPVPVGVSVSANYNAQIARGTAARMMLRHYDFLPGSTELSAAGRRRLAWIVPELGRTPWFLLIEATPRQPGLDEARRLALAAALAETAAVSPDRLRIAHDAAIAVRGPESLLIEAAQMGRVAAEGPPVGDSTGPGAFAGDNAAGGSGGNVISR